LKAAIWEAGTSRNEDNMRNTFVKSLCSLARADGDVLLLSGDLGFGVLNVFWDEFPGRFFNAGIAEQGMTGLAAGLALSGKTVFTYSIGNFPTIRCLEQIRNDCAYHGANVKIVSVGAGFAYGPLGMSHHATEDIAFMRGLPGITIFSPADPAETERCTRLMYETEGTCYMRLGRGGESRIHDGALNFSLGEVLRVSHRIGRPSGRKIAFFTTGSIVSEVLAASEVLHGSGSTVSVYTCPSLKPLDQGKVLYCASRYDIIATVEEHGTIGGLGSAIAEILAGRNGRRASLVRIGIDDTYATKVGSQEYLRREYGLSPEGIVRRVLKK
jgi:transketolase